MHLSLRIMINIGRMDCWLTGWKDGWMDGWAVKSMEVTVRKAWF